MEDQQRIEQLAYATPKRLEFRVAKKQRLYVRIIGSLSIIAGVSIWIAGQFFETIDQGHVIPIGVIVSGIVQWAATIFPQLGLFPTNKDELAS